MNAGEAGGWSWQLIFFSAAVVIVLLEALRGWRLGLARQVVRLLGLAAAYGAALTCGRALVPIARTLVKWPDPLLSFLGGALLALVVYSVVSGLGTIFFKRTVQQNSRALRLLYGTSGAVVGIFFGLFFVFLIFTGIRLAGSVAQAQLRAQESLTSPAMRMRPAPLLRQQVSTAPTPSPLALTLGAMKQSLETGALGSRLKTVDPLPGTIYLRLEKLGEISGRPAAIERFRNYPGARQLSEHPRMLALRDDPKVMELAARGRILELLQNEKVLAATNDPLLRAQLSKFELDRALDYALQNEPVAKSKPPDVSSK